MLLFRKHCFGFCYQTRYFLLAFLYIYSPFKPQCSAKYLIFWGGVPKYYGATQDPECLIDMFVCYTKGRSKPTSYHLPMHLISSFIYTFSPLFSGSFKFQSSKLNSSSIWNSSGNWSDWILLVQLSFYCTAKATGANDASH